MAGPACRAETCYFPSARGGHWSGLFAQKTEGAAGDGYVCMCVWWRVFWGGVIHLPFSRMHVFTPKLLEVIC